MRHMRAMHTTSTSPTRTHCVHAPSTRLQWSSGALSRSALSSVPSHTRRTASPSQEARLHPEHAHTAPSTSRALSAPESPTRDTSDRTVRAQAARTKPTSLRPSGPAQSVHPLPHFPSIPHLRPSPPAAAPLRPHGLSPHTGRLARGSGRSPTAPRLPQDSHEGRARPRAAVARVCLARIGSGR